MTFQHFIITRFNVNIHPTTYDFRLSESWLAERFELFNKFCLPSIRQQESQEFKWLVLFDSKTPERFRRIIMLLESYQNLVPIFCDDFSSVMPQVREHIQQMRQDADYYLTTRLDNDDALSQRFVKMLHGITTDLIESQKMPGPEVFINFPSGLQYCDGTVYDFCDVTNAFVSLLERCRDEPPHTVFWVDHPDIYSKAPVAQIETKPIYLQNVHGMNVYNYIRGTKTNEEGILAEFNLNI